MSKSKILFTTLVLLASFMVVSADAGHLTVELNAGSYEIAELSNQLQEIKMEDFGNLLTPGKPMLPARTFLIALPLGAEVSSVMVIGAGGTELPGIYRITPAPPVAPSDHRQDLIKESMQVWQQNYKASYSSDQVYPEEVGWYVGTGGLRKYTFVRVTYSPFAYQPLSGKLFFYSSATVSIDYSLPAAGSQEAREVERLMSDTVADKQAFRLFANYSQAREWYADKKVEMGPMQPYNYVIITTTSLQSVVSSLVAWKQSIGYTVNVVTTSWINSNYSGSDLPEKIRNFLVDKYMEWGIEYVLLVGDIGDVPMRVCYPKANDPNEDTPTDYYYADLTGNWNSDGDSYYGEYGEDNVDWVPEVIVGRIPWSDATTVANICQKIVNFEGDTGSWKDDALLLGAMSNYQNEDYSGWDRTDGSTLMELKKDLIQNIGGSSTTMYEKAGLSPCTVPCTAALTHANVVSYWSSGQYGMVNWWAHGSWDAAWRYWWTSDDGDGVPESFEMTWEAFIAVSDCPSLNDQYPSIIFSCSCDNGWPESNNLGKNLLKQGSSSIVASSRISWYSIGWQDETWGGNASIDYFFFDYMLTQDEKVGDALFDSKVYYLNNFFWWGWQSQQNMFDFNLYGEPALYRPGVPGGQNPLIRGDYDCDGQVLTNDPLMELQHIFGVTGAAPPSCEDAADYDDDGSILTNDPVMALQFIFGVLGSTPPRPPYPGCGSDPTGDDLGCGWHEFCMGGGKGMAYKPSMSVKGVENRLVVGEILPVDGVVGVSVDLILSEAVCGYDISLGYDASSLRFEEVVGGDSYDFYAVDTRQEGVVRIGGVPDIEMAKLMEPGTHRVAEVVFSVEKKRDMGLSWKNVELYGSNVQPLSVEWVDGLVKAGAGLPTEFALNQNYPNPFNPTTLIKYDLPVDCQVRLDVYNVAGQRVAILVDGWQKVGYKTVSWDAQDLASGIYFYRLRAGDFSSIRKMVVLK